MFSIRESKKEALSKLRERWMTPVLLTLVIGAITLALSVPGIISNMRSYYGALMTGYGRFSGFDFSLLSDAAQRPVFAGMLDWMLQMIVFVITGAISIASARFYLSVISNPEKTGFGTFFEGLTHWGKGILASFWMNLWLSLWCMLFFGILFALAIIGMVIGMTNGADLFFVTENPPPALIAVFCVIMFAWCAAFFVVLVNRAYAYSLMLFIQAEYPAVSVSKTLKASIAMTKGCRGKLFLLDASFLGWGILAALTLGIGTLWLYPYISATRAVVYRCLKAQAFENGLFVTSRQPAIDLPREEQP
jgi:uncharacterized membrane protein